MQFNTTALMEFDAFDWGFLKNIFILKKAEVENNTWKVIRRNKLIVKVKKKKIG